MTQHKGFGIIAALVALNLGACASANAHPSVTAATSPPQSAQPTVTPPSPTATPFPPTAFQPDGLSAISDSDFWVMGTQACAATCRVEVLHTVNGGSTFERIPAPPVDYVSGSTNPGGPPSVFGIRFADESDGWVFGDSLWATHDAGADWVHVNPLTGVTQLEPGANGYVYAVFEVCPPFSPCKFQLMRSLWGINTWTAIVPPGSPAGLPVIGVHGDTLWVMYFQRSTPLEWISHDDGRTFVRGSMPCEPDLDGSFDPVSNSVIWSFCATGTEGGALVSTSGGTTFSAVPRPVGEFSNAGSVAAVSALTAFIFDPLDGMKVTTNGGRTYGDIHELDGAVWAGFTDAEVGYVIVNEQPKGAVRLWRTSDAGAEWSIVSLP